MEKKYVYSSDYNSFEISIGKLAEQANGSCLIKSGDSTVLVTAVAAERPRDGIDFFPLTCEYQEKMYAVGKIPGGYIKREGKSSDHATLTSRMIDRPIRPLFPEGYVNEVQVIATVFSSDADHDTGILSMIGSSVALTISDIPFKGPIGAVSVGYIDGKFIINPSEDEAKISEMELTVAGTKDAIMMVEAGAKELPESVMLEAILFGHEEIKRICEFIEEIQKEIGLEKKEFQLTPIDEGLKNSIKEILGSRLTSALQSSDKMERQDNLNALEEELLEKLVTEEVEDKDNLTLDIKAIFDSMMKAEVRRLITDEHIRPDGRQMTEIRPLSAEVKFIPKVHGSGLFKRGQTQVLTVATLGSPSDVQYIDGMTDEEITKRYIHHYNFPPFSVGDIRPLRGPGRREIGHGRLAERALEAVLPAVEDFPYTIRLVSEVLSSNGSSSMASVCGSTLSLMDAGVPIKSPVAGIAMGLIKENDNIAILTDIQGLEDHLGDMDFKVAGTADGVTALQMDIKIDGIDREILETALADAKDARLRILKVITDALPAPRPEIAPNAPRLLTIDVHPDKVREVIGSGGKVINGIIDKTGVKIDIEDDGHITITASDEESGKEAIKMIEYIVLEPEVGEVYLGKITRIMNFGAFAEFANAKEGLIHISQIAHERVNKVEDVLKVGDEVMVKVMEIDEKGRINLSRKALLPNNNRDRHHFNKNNK
ncbi:MAG: polyribonucleotide nucleotidyltransferase [Tissierellia bacterium]|nr:polyribonucleotide nucleotidyltransferase [Tissierellia bacterium]